MFFDPLSTWLVVLLADGIIAANEKFGSSSALGEWERECIMQHNRELNDAIRDVKESTGYSEESYEKIKCHISFAASRYPSNGSYEHIRIDLDNQKYIISVLEECAKICSQKPEEASRKRAEEYNQALTTIKNRYNAALIRREEQKTTDAGCIKWFVLIVTMILAFIGFLILLKTIFD